ncbi:MAG: TetR/AcrR family transcriptional regulator [Rhodobiaceae bacterium]|nr:TetR/AcrR family transcriptional regulator [Rhodobiaceae bacterium]
MSKREANKAEKLLRIRHAAQELFEQRGYDDTTMREIARQAKVALGTLFLYASNKRDLLFLIANETMEEAVSQAARLCSADHGLIDNFMTLTILHLRIFGRQPALFRLVLRELLFYDSGEQGRRATRNRARMLELIANWVAAAEGCGEIDLPQPPDFIAWMLFSVMQAELRRWIALEEQDLEDGIRHCWAAAALLLNGFARAPVAADAGRGDIERLAALTS